MGLGQSVRANTNIHERLNFETSSVWRRLSSGVVDWLVVLAWGSGIGALAAFVFGLLNVSSFGLNFILGTIFSGCPITCVVLMWKQVAAAFSISSTGGTFGHTLFGLRIAAKNGQRIGRRRALVRQFLGSPLLSAFLVSMILLILLVPIAAFTDLNGGLGDALVTNWLIWGSGVAAVLALANHVWKAFDAEGRGCHDWVVGTVVVDRVGL